MQRIIPLGVILVVIVGILYACSGGTTPTDDPQGILSGRGAGVSLADDGRLACGHGLA